MWPFIKFGGGAIIVLVVISMIGTCAGVITSPFRGAASVVEKTFNGNNMLDKYEYFYQQNQDYNATVTKLMAARTSYESFKADAGPRDKWTFEDKQADSRQRSIVLGLEGMLAGIAADYNANSQKRNRALFKANDLPFELSRTIN